MDLILLSSAHGTGPRVMAELMSKGEAEMEATYSPGSCMGEYVVSQPYDVVANVMNDGWRAS
jgi:hypothetical protein